MVTKTTIKKRKLCDLCTEEKQAYYHCNFCGKDMCREHRYFMSYVEKVSKYIYKNHVCKNLCNNCYEKGVAWLEKVTHNAKRENTMEIDNSFMPAIAGGMIVILLYVILLSLGIVNPIW